MTARGLATSPIPHGARMFEIELDFITHELIVRASDGRTAALPLEAQSISAFHHRLMDALVRLDIPVHIHGRPNEMAESIRFDADDRARPREAYSHEVSSCGFWAGGDAIPYAAFYAYAYPEPDGFASAQVSTGDAFYHTDLREFILPYDAVRQSASPDHTLLGFLQSTYDAAANLGSWNRAELEWSEHDPAPDRRSGQRPAQG